MFSFFPCLLNASVKCPGVGGKVTLDVWPRDIQPVKVMRARDKELKIHEAENVKLQSEVVREQSQHGRAPGLGWYQISRADLGIWEL
ncbi:hypothetical protein E2C01_027270 [Portunus trituberculatus]|uniref:Uncharacterized protein n=1 Tax=Portunus trituberculatus TaxID=210409 RepID=A0A5B7EIA9_PORTR|nr:hypothetical protein [Portunus trituberculatus]